MFTDDEERVLVEAIGLAERGNKGEIHVHIDRGARGDVEAHALALWEELGLGATAEDTGVLLYVAVDRREVRVLAGHGILGTAREGFWQEAADAVATGFKAGDPLGGIRRALQSIGDLLRTVVPGDPEGNELPDGVTRG